MDPLEEQLAQLSLLNSRALPVQRNNNYAADNGTQIYHNDAVKKIAPIVPPKPEKKIQQIRESLYASCKDMKSPTPTLISRQSLISDAAGIYHKPNKETLDNPAVLEQKLEALAYHKQQLDKKKNQQQHAAFDNIPKLSSSSLVHKELRPKQYASSNIYTNFNVAGANASANASAGANGSAANVYGNLLMQKQAKAMEPNKRLPVAPLDSSSYKLYCNVPFEKPTAKPSTANTALPLTTQMLSMQAAVDDDFVREHDELPPPSPVSSSYSELRRATNIFQNSATPAASKVNSSTPSPNIHYVEKPLTPRQTNAYGEVYVDNSTTNEFSNYSLNLEGGSSTYESIYEPINPRPSSQLSARFNYLNYSPYENAAAIAENNASAAAANSNFGSLPRPSGSYPSDAHQHGEPAHSSKLDTLSSYLETPTIDEEEDAGETEHYGVCYKCNQRVLDETSGCTAMDQIYHIACFTCFQCQINLQGKPFYGIDGKPYCEYDYLQTLEKCSVCMKPILERILRATGKPYHPQCFTCVVCGNSLDGIPFTVDATNQNYCIEDFHKKFAPRCCVCKEPIMPEPGEEETVRVVALDRSFHFQCYKCEDCGLLLSSEAEGRGCYPLDDHVLCKSCNARRVQLLTNRMTTEL